MGAGIGRRLTEVHLEDEAALERRVEVAGEVGGGDHDALERLHLLKDDVLDAVLHLVHSAGRTFHPHSEDGVGLVEEEDRSYLAVTDERFVLIEERADVFLTVTDPLALEL